MKEYSRRTNGVRFFFFLGLSTINSNCKILILKLIDKLTINRGTQIVTFCFLKLETENPSRR